MLATALEGASCDATTKNLTQPIRFKGIGNGCLDLPGRAHQVADVHAFTIGHPCNGGKVGGAKVDGGARKLRVAMLQFDLTELRIHEDHNTNHPL